MPPYSQTLIINIALQTLISWTRDAFSTLTVMTQWASGGQKQKQTGHKTKTPAGGRSWRNVGGNLRDAKGSSTQCGGIGEGALWQTGSDVVAGVGMTAPHKCYSQCLRHTTERKKISHTSVNRVRNKGCTHLFCGQSQDSQDAAGNVAARPRLGVGSPTSDLMNSGGAKIGPIFPLQSLERKKTFVNNLHLLLWVGMVTGKPRPSQSNDSVAVLIIGLWACGGGHDSDTASVINLNSTNSLAGGLCSRLHLAQHHRSSEPPAHTMRQVIKPIGFHSLGGQSPLLLYVFLEGWRDKAITLETIFFRKYKKQVIKGCPCTVLTKKAKFQKGISTS